MFQVANVLFAIAFLLATAVQYNDPDPYLWMPTYLVAFACCLAFTRNKLLPRVGYAVAAVALLWSFTLIPTVVSHPPALADVFGDVKMYAPGVEEAREAGGLWLIAAWVSALARRVQRGRLAT
jgi:hypothetical protein